MSDPSPLDRLAELSQACEQAAKAQLDDALARFDCLSIDDKLDLFCAIVFRLKRSEIDESRSYRGVLYDGFGFGMDSYGRALDAGFAELHNAIYTRERLLALVQASMNMRAEGVLNAEDVLARLRKSGLT